MIRLLSKLASEPLKLVSMSNKHKKSFIFYASWKEVLMSYPSEVRLEVYDAVIEYAISGTLSELKPLAKMAFAFIQRDIDANDEKYNDIVSKRSEAGKKGMKARWGEKTNTCYNEITNVTNITDNVNDNVNEDDNGNVLDVHIQEEKLSGEKIVKKKEDRIDYKSIVEKFNAMLAPPLPKVIALSDARKAAIKARINEHGLDNIDTVFSNVATSKFLRGETENGWKCYFDWIFNPRNFIKILEGNYADNRANYSEKQKANNYAMQQFIDDCIARESKLVEEVEKPF